MGVPDRASRAVPVRGSRFLVTGGAGFVGSHLVEALLAGGARELRILDDLSRGERANLEAPLADGRCSLVEGDVADGSLVAELADGMDAIVHFAALRCTLCAEAGRRCAETMLMGSFNVFEAARLAGCRRVLYASSAALYGQAETLPTPESAPPWPDTSLYGAAKLAGEGMGRAFAATHGLSVLALRPFNLYGPRMSHAGPHTEVLVRWARRLDEGLPPVIHGDGAHGYDFVYVSDAVDAWLRACESPLDGGVWNLGSGISTSLRELALALCRAWGRVDLEPEHVAERAGMPTVRRQADVAACARDLGWRASTSLDEGLDRFVRWWKEGRR